MSPRGADDAGVVYGARRRQRPPGSGFLLEAQNFQRRAAGLWSSAAMFSIGGLLSMPRRSVPSPRRARRPPRWLPGSRHAAFA